MSPALHSGCRWPCAAAPSAGTAVSCAAWFKAMTADRGRAVEDIARRRAAPACARLNPPSVPLLDLAEAQPMARFDHRRPKLLPPDALGELERGRAAHTRRAWAEAFELLSLADEKAALACEDLERLATAAYLLGRDDDYLKTLERSHHAHLAVGSEVRAARSAFWLGLRLSFRGEAGHAAGWFARAHRLLERTSHDHVEGGYLLLPVVEQQLGAGQSDAAYESAKRAAEIGEHFAEADLIAIARHLQGHVRLRQGQVVQGLALLDEAMVAITTGDVSPLVTGLVYCGVIEGCQLVYALGRAREWTSALAVWCEQQPEMVAFTGLCQVHRSEILQLHGAWPEALAAARRAGERCRGINPEAAAAALYQEAEVYRLHGELDAAEQAYRSASAAGREPQPGLSLLRVAQGRSDLAVAAITRVLRTTGDRVQLTRLLPAYVEIMLAAGDVASARSACNQLDDIASTIDSDVLGAMAAHARGCVELAEGNPQVALGSLRCACRVWKQVDAPYVVARLRELIGLCCRELGDNDGGNLELEAARKVFARLAAALDLARVDAVLRGVPARSSHGLSARELQVLRLLAAGKTNKAIAAELFLSEKTIERHVSNLFTKLDVRSRAAATAYAYEHALI
jgi:DNA-binding CsgD family transcriptional regulator